ncbi:glutathione S-transferase 1-like [Epargyreus clarus]|uniref:glutathione S-transferase 1-like n=1 Tax=Epargyreus clarus TaxID=520877 RepID=UPI003C2D8A06
MTIDLYFMPSSAPCRAVNLVASALGIYDKINQRKLDLMSGEHLKPEFVKLNPQHIIPTLVDDGFSLWESRAICRYLVNKYGGGNNPLYPADVKARAVVDQRLDFDMGTLYAKFAVYFNPRFFGGHVEKDSLQKLLEALGFLNLFLESSKYVAGDDLTIADLCLVATLSTIDVIGFSLKKYQNILRWYELVQKTAPNYQKANAEPLEEFRTMIKNKK